MGKSESYYQSNVSVGGNVHGPAGGHGISVICRGAGCSKQHFGIKWRHKHKGGSSYSAYCAKCARGENSNLNTSERNVFWTIKCKECYGAIYYCGSDAWSIGGSYNVYKGYCSSCCYSRCSYCRNHYTSSRCYRCYKTCQKCKKYYNSYNNGYCSYCYKHCNNCSVKYESYHEFHEKCQKKCKCGSIILKKVPFCDNCVKKSIKTCKKCHEPFNAAAGICMCSATKLNNETQKITSESKKTSHEIYKATDKIKEAIIADTKYEKSDNDAISGAQIALQGFDELANLEIPDDSDSGAPKPSTVIVFTIFGDESSDDEEKNDDDDADSDTDTDTDDIDNIINEPVIRSMNKYFCYTDGQKYLIIKNCQPVLLNGEFEFVGIENNNEIYIGLKNTLAKILVTNENRWKILFNNNPLYVSKECGRNATKLTWKPVHQYATRAPTIEVGRLFKKQITEWQQIALKIKKINHKRVTRVFKHVNQSVLTLLNVKKRIISTIVNVQKEEKNIENSIATFVTNTNSQQIREAFGLLKEYNTSLSYKSFKSSLEVYNNIIELNNMILDKVGKRKKKIFEKVVKIDDIIENMIVAAEKVIQKF